MEKYRIISKVIVYLGYVFIKEKVQVRGLFFWKTLDTRHYGPYTSKIEAHIAVSKRGTKIIEL